MDERFPPTPGDTLGRRVLEAFTAALGEPMVLESQQWHQYHWTVARRPRPALNIYLTIGPDHAPVGPQVLIGDPCQPPDDTLRMLTVAGEDEIAPLVADVRGRMQCA